MMAITTKSSTSVKPSFLSVHGWFPNTVHCTSANSAYFTACRTISNTKRLSPSEVTSTV